MPATITVRCHGCKARLRAPIQLLGECRLCPACKTPVRIRVQPLADSDPLLAVPRHKDAR
jgi:hypothetical protein